MVFRTMRAILFLFLISCLAGALPVWAQSTSTGTVAGTVTDASGAVVAGANVTLTDTATHTQRTTTTNDAGRYIFVDVNPSTYNLDVNKQGFSTTKVANQEVRVGAALTLNVALQVGGTSTVVEVEATGTELQTMNATVGNTVTAAALDNLPSIGRDVSTFIELQPGVSTGGDVAGAVNDQSYFSLDGGNNTNDMDGSGGVYTSTQQGLVIGDPTGGVATEMTYSAPSGVMPTPADSVEEFKVNTAGQTADFNSSAGAEVKVVTKRGTNAFHGTLYEYYRDNNWSSNTWQNNWLNYLPGNHVDLPSYHYSRFGGALGGPITSKELLGGRSFFFVNYEGFRYPNSETITRNVPSPALRLGLLTDSVTGNVDYNLNNAPVTFNGKTYAANYGCTGTCDPLGLGLNPVVSQIWSKYEPSSNAGCSLSLCDGSNILGYSANLSLPIKSNFGVMRLDHDFSAKHHLMGSYRYYNIQLAGDNQVDIGGFFTGDTKGVPASASSDPVQDWYLVLGLTSNFTSTLTNDIHYSWLRNWWAWNRNGAPPQVAGMGGALEIVAGQSQTQDLTPFNSDNQNIRRRFWDGHDQMFRDDISLLKGNHLFQFGGTYQHNWDYHQRNDSGGTINAFPVYSVGYGSSGAKLDTTGFQPCSGASTNGATSINNCSSVAAGVLGAVSVASQLFTRSGPNLALNQPLSNAFDKSTIPYYNVYFSDTWHMKPTFTFTYGLGWALEMPPVEQNGKQAMLVDQAANPVSVTSYINERRAAALKGEVFNPELGFALVGNTAGGRKYPYNPYYGEFSPRVAVAWNPKFDADSFGGKLFGSNDTVIRGGYGRSYSRLNGVTQVLLPLLGLGLEQPIGCSTNVATGAGGWTCSGSPTFNNAFRVSTAATASGGPSVPLGTLATPTLPQPVFPGYNNTFSATDSALDPNFKPAAIDSFDLTIQRQLNRRLTVEIGYIGRIMHNEYEPVDLNAIPYMTTKGGQTFASAYANLLLQLCGGVAGLAGGGCGGSALPTPGPGPNLGAVQPQPFFETAMKGSSYCTTPVQVSTTSTITPANCTQAVALNEGIAPFPFGNLTNAQVWSLWSDLDNGGFNPNILPRSLMSTPIPDTCATLNPGTTSTLGCSGSFSSPFMDAAVGHSNYNAAFVSLKMADWRGLTMQSNFTWSKALGTGAQAQSSSELTTLDPFNINEMYGRQAFNRKFIYNMFMVYQPPFFKGQNGFVGRALGGWTFASIFTAGGGVPDQAVTTFADYQSFGACDGTYCADYDSENAVPIAAQSMHTSAHYCVKQSDVSSGFAACPGQAPGSSYPVNAFSGGAANYVNWRNPILGVDNRDGGYGILTGLSYWNMDFSIKKNIRVAESVGLEFQGVFANVLNHDQWFDGFPYLGSPTTWGALGGQTGGPRQIELGARVRF